MKILSTYFGPIRPLSPLDRPPYDYFGMERHYKEVHITVEVGGRTYHYRNTYPSEIPFKEVLKYAKGAIGRLIMDELFAKEFG